MFPFAAGSFGSFGFGATRLLFGAQPEKETERGFCCGSAAAAAESCRFAMNPEPAAAAQRRAANREVAGRRRRRRKPSKIELHCSGSGRRLAAGARSGRRSVLSCQRKQRATTTATLAQRPRTPVAGRLETTCATGSERPAFQALHIHSLARPVYERALQLLPKLSVGSSVLPPPLLPVSAFALRHSLVVLIVVIAVAQQPSNERMRRRAAPLRVRC